ncbi:MAG TPA: dTMP kinase [Candidatus Aquicultor sp.]|jgi:dTMP kinase
MRNGLFITFEGIEGSGKSTQIDLLDKYLQKQEHTVITTREPGGTTIGAEIRQILLNPANTGMDYHTEVLLYAADRAQHVFEQIMPALEQDLTVISDRYIDSSIAYQHYGRELPLDFILEINNRSVQWLKPDITFLLDVPVGVGLERATRVSADRIEQESFAFHERVRIGYLALAEKNPGRWRLIDGTQPVDAAHAAIVEAIKPLL